jgi:putative transposase
MYRRQAILCHDDIRTALRSGIMETRKTHPFKVDAWVLMPDHLHCIWTLPENDINFSTRYSAAEQVPDIYRIAP